MTTTDSPVHHSCSLVLNEVYDGELDGFVQRGNEFFALMPKPGDDQILSEHSPLRESPEEDSDDTLDEALGRATT